MLSFLFFFPLKIYSILFLPKFYFFLSRLFYTFFTKPPFYISLFFPIFCMFYILFLSIGHFVFILFFFVPVSCSFPPFLLSFFFLVTCLFLPIGTWKPGNIKQCYTRILCQLNTGSTNPVAGRLFSSFLSLPVRLCTMGTPFPAPENRRVSVI